MTGPGSGRIRVRYGRLGAATSALVVTLVAVLGGVGLLPAHSPAAATARTGNAGDSAALSSFSVPEALPRSRQQATPGPTTPAPTPTLEVAEAALPADSGSGKRVVFDISDQRVWLVGADDEVRRTYLASGSIYDNLRPGTFEVYSTSRWAVGIDDSGVMEYFVRFTRGENAPIGFHSIPTKDGRPLQTRAQLGTPLSHGCIRQARPDAKRLWDFAPVGTTVVVTA